MAIKTVRKFSIQDGGDTYVMYSPPVVANYEKFKITKRFSSIAEMNAYTGSDVTDGDFVIVLSDDGNNGKVYLRMDNQYFYVNNFSDLSTFVNAESISSIEIADIFDFL